MLSGALAGILRVGAVVLTGGGLATGVYFLVQVGQEDDASRLQTEATATVAAPAPLSPPIGLSPPADVIAPSPTPTFPPAPITPPAVNTSDWLTYASPLGFTIKYPPTWTVIEGSTPESVKIFNEKAQEERARRLPEGVFGGAAASGEAWMEILPDPYPHFDVDALFQICGVQDETLRQQGYSVQATEVVFAGLPAVSCVQEGPTPDGQRQINVQLFWIGLPSGRVVHIAGYAVDGDQATLGLLQAILPTVSFEAVQ